MALNAAHLAATTSAIATVIFSKALEKSGEHVGDAVYQRAKQLVQSVRDKFEQQGSMGTLTEAQEHPSEQNISQFTKELADLMSEDESFAATIEESLLSFSEEADLQAIFTDTILSEEQDWLSQPLSVQQFKETSEQDNSELKAPLKVQPEE